MRSELMLQQESMWKGLSATLLFAAFTALHGCVSAGSFDASGVIERSSFFNGTDTLPAEVFETEVGIEVSPSDSFALETLLAYGLSEDTEVQLLLETYRFDETESPELEGVGDLALGLTHRLSEETTDLPSFGVEFAASVPVRSDDDPLRSDGVDLALGFIASRWMGPQHVSATLTFAAIDRDTDPALDFETELGLFFARGLTPSVAGFLGTRGLYSTETDEVEPALSAGCAIDLGPHAMLDVGVELDFEAGEGPNLTAALTWAW